MADLTLKLDGIAKLYGDFRALDGVHMEIEQGSIRAILGENGAGKTILMNILFGRYQPEEGEIYLNRKVTKIPSPRIAMEMGIGMIHQHFMLVDTLTGAENVALGLPDQGVPPAIANAGNDHLGLALRQRARLAAMNYDLEAGRRLMEQHGLTTINLIRTEGPRQFQSRNAFAIGGVAEDPATGAAAAALAGYLRDFGWPHGGGIEITQGTDMGMPSKLKVTIPDEPGSPVLVSGSTRTIG